MPISMRIPAGRMVGAKLAISRANNFVTQGTTNLLASVDGPNSWYRPTTTAEFQALGLAVPDFLYPCQEASGDLVSITGTKNLVTNGTGHLYQQSINNWTNKFVGLPSQAGGNSWRVTHTINSGESFAALLYITWAAVAVGVRIMATAGAANGIRAGSDATSGNLRSVNANINTDGAVIHEDPNLEVVHQIVWYRNAATDRSGIETDLESITATHNEAASTSTLALGAEGSATPAEFRTNYLALYYGTNAEQNWANYLSILRRA